MIQTAEGKLELKVFQNSLEIEEGFREREIAVGDDVLYRGLICMVLTDGGDGYYLMPVGNVMNGPIQVVMD